MPNFYTPPTDLSNYPTKAEVPNFINGGALTLSLVPLVTAPEIALQSTLLGAMTVTPSNTNVWPGCQFRIRAPSSIGLFSLTLTGLIGGLTSTILGGGDKTVVYTANGWRA